MSVLREGPPRPVICATDGGGAAEDQEQREYCAARQQFHDLCLHPSTTVNVCLVSRGSCGLVVWLI